MHPLSTVLPGLPTSESSDWAPLRHPEGTAYRCFVPNLAGFADFCRAGPNPQHFLAPAVPEKQQPRVGIRSRCSGLRVQGTASSPSSTTSIHATSSMDRCQGRRFAGSTVNLHNEGSSYMVRAGEPPRHPWRVRAVARWSRSCNHRKRSVSRSTAVDAGNCRSGMTWSFASAASATTWKAVLHRTSNRTGHE